MSSAVITLVDAPTNPVPVRLAETSIVGSTSVLRCACAAVAVKPASATSAPQILRFVPMTQRSFVCARAKADASGETKPDAKDTLSGTHTTTRDAHVCNVVGEAALTASHRHCRHRCERPLRMDAPSTGWVTALAGLLARGSLLSCVRPSRFPSGHADAGSPLTVAGAATDFCEFAKDEPADSVFPLSSPESPGEPARQNVPLNRRTSQAPPPAALARSNRRFSRPSWSSPDASCDWRAS